MKSESSRQAEGKSKGKKEEKKLVRDWVREKQKKRGGTEKKE